VVAVSRTVVDVHDYTHTCPGDPVPHIVDSRRTVVEYIPSGPCLHPVAVRSGARVVDLPCGRVLPVERQCAACRPVVTVRTVTTTHLGPYVRTASTAPSGYAARPCWVCGKPLAAVLAGDGRHLLCEPWPVRR
jgi:hypothetical protein